MKTTTLIIAGCTVAAVGLLFAVIGCEIAPPAADVPDATGDFCGGIAGVACPDGFYCAFEDGTCDVADRSGACAVRPETCTMEYDPVCGCDGVTYGNRCVAAGSEASIDFAGECP